MTEQAIFKKCPMCSSTWKSINEFLDDRTLFITGYQANFDELEYGFFYFTHDDKGCGSTLAIRAEAFLHLNPGRRYPERKTGLQECPGYCSDDQKLDRCLAKCEGAFVRDIIHIIRERHRQADSARLSLHAGR